jgi:hypothetical protein
MKWVLAKMSTVGTLLIVSSVSTALAGTVPFTWDPSKSTPPLTGSPASFTADNISVTNYLRSVNTNNFTTMQQTFTEEFIQPITGFTRTGSSVTAPGLDNSYGLYFTLNGTGRFPIDGSGNPAGAATFNNLSLSLVADVHHDDGTVSSTLSGVAFSNPTGVLNDVTLATGTLVSAELSRDAAGVRHAHFIETFVPGAGQGDFFAGPTVTVDWEEFLTTLPDAFQLITIDPLTSAQLVNGGTGQAGLIPEPTSFVLLLTAFAGFGVIRRINPTC